MYTATQAGLNGIFDSHLLLILLQFPERHFPSKNFYKENNEGAQLQCIVTSSNQFH